MPRLIDDDPALPGEIFTFQDALRAGFTQDQIRHRVRSGRWIPLRRGVYRLRSAAEVQPTTAAERLRVDHVARAIAACRSHPGAIVAFESAAALDGLDGVRPLSGDVALVPRPGGWIGRRRGVVFHDLRIPSEHVVAGEVLATATERTWLDLARTGSLSEAIVVGDSVLRSGKSDLAALREMAETCSGLRGAKQALRALRHLDPIRETALESASWSYFVENRVRFPRAQVTIELPPAATSGSPRVARVDWLWEEHRLIGECDGRIKYAGPDALYAEKLREDRLRQLGFTIIRWGWDDLRTAALAARLSLALR